MLPPIENGEHLDQPAFHQRYVAMPNGFRAELIGGWVIVPSPLSADHVKVHALIIGWLIAYVEQTPGLLALDNATLVLGGASEPQPDAALIIEPGFGGQTSVDAGYIVGAPELIVEIASSSQAYDLYEKCEDYERAGVREYVVVMIRGYEVSWFELDDDGNFRVRPADDDSVFRSRAFPGLWLRPLSLLELNLADLMATLRQGPADRSHAEFVDRLVERRREQ